MDVAGHKLTQMPGPVQAACLVMAPPGRVLNELHFPE